MVGWIKFSDAREALIDHLLRTIESDVLEAAQTASRLLINALMRGELPARCRDVESYFFEFTLAGETTSFPLDEPFSTIPNWFWKNWHAACEVQARQPLHVESASFANSFGEEFCFRLADRRDGGVYEGEAADILLRKDCLPGKMPSPKGRPAQDDAEVVLTAAQALGRGEWWYDVMDAAVAKSVGSCPTAIRQRLRMKLRDLGYRGVSGVLCAGP